MRTLRLLLALILLFTPMAIHVDDADDAWYGMAPIGGIMWDEGELRIGFYSYNWYTKDGRTKYLQNAVLDLSAVKLFNIAFIQNDDGDLTYVGIITLIAWYAIAAYMLLCLFENRIIGIIASTILLLLSIAMFVAFFLIDSDFTSMFDSNFPLFSLVGFVIAIVGIVVDAMKRET